MARDVKQKHSYIGIILFAYMTHNYTQNNLIKPLLKNTNFLDLGDNIIIWSDTIILHVMIEKNER